MYSKKIITMHSLSLEFFEKQDRHPLILFIFYLMAKNYNLAGCKTIFGLVKHLQTTELFIASNFSFTLQSATYKKNIK